MPSFLVKRVNLDLIYAPFLQKYLEVLAKCHARGAHYYAQFGTRTVEEQNRLFAQGRTAPGPKVTDAKGGLSTHNYGIATDSVRDADMVRVGLQPAWADEGYAILKEEGEAAGLQVGVPGLGDLGHVQLPLAKKLQRREKSVLLELRGIYLSAPEGEGLKACWAKLDEWGFGP